MIYSILCILIIFMDFFTKKMAVAYLKVIDTKPILNGVLHLTYVENRGAAFGILSNSRWIFLTITVIVIIGLLFYIIKNKPSSILFMISISLIIGGAVGNMIDRIKLGYVVDFIDFRLINFPVFNVADIAVCVGTGLFALYIIFDKELNKNE